MNKGVIDWLSNEAMLRQVYHDHKENMAWVATVLYLTAAISVGFMIRTHIASYSKALVIILFLIVTICAAGFIYWQFSKRLRAAQTVEALELAEF